MEAPTNSTHTFQLSTLLDDEIEVESFCKFVKAHGFAKIAVTEEYEKIFHEIFEIMKTYFAGSYNDKNSHAYDSAKEVGYYNNSRLSKEFFAIRKNSATTQIQWPNEHFGTQAIKLYDTLDKLARTILGFLARGIKVPSSSLEQLCDNTTLPNGTYATSMLHLFNYYGQPTDSMALSCTEHTDSGLVTSRSPSMYLTLQSFLVLLSQWVSVESPIAPNEVTVLCGETLARLTCNYYQGTVHKVVFNEKPRMSIPFQLRGRPDAVSRSVGAVERLGD